MIRNVLIASALSGAALAAVPAAGSAHPATVTCINDVGPRVDAPTWVNPKTGQNVYVQDIQLQTDGSWKVTWADGYVRILPAIPDCEVAPTPPPAPTPPEVTPPEVTPPPKPHKHKRVVKRVVDKIISCNDVGIGGRAYHIDKITIRWYTDGALVKTRVGFVRVNGTVCAPPPVVG